MAPSGACADHLRDERAWLAPDRGRPERDLARGLGRGRGRRDRGVPVEARGLSRLPRVETRRSLTRENWRFRADKAGYPLRGNAPAKPPRSFRFWRALLYRDRPGA